MTVPPDVNQDVTQDRESTRYRKIVIGSAVIYTLLLSAYVVAILWIDTARVDAPHFVRGPDSLGYEAAARNWPWESQAARAAPIFPLLLRFAFNNLRAVVLLQTMAWGFAWFWLARAASMCVSRLPIRVAILAVLLSLSLSPELLTWNSAIGSEAISVSLVIATFACTITATRIRSPRWWVLTASLGALATLARDTNAILGVVLIAAAIVVGVRKVEFRRSAAACALISMSAILVSSALSSMAEPPRWFYPLQENIVVRITPRADFVKFFTDRGMPQAQEVSEMRENYFLTHLEMRENPRFAPFRQWLRDNGPRVYGEFVLTHLPWQTELFVSFREELLLESVVPFGKIVDSNPGVIYRALGRLSFWHSANGVIAWAALALLVLSVGRFGWRREDRLVRGVLLVGITTAIVHIYASFAADAFEIDRHAFSATVQLRVMLWITTLIMIDRWVVRLRLSRASSSEASNQRA